MPTMRHVEYQSSPELGIPKIFVSFIELGTADDSFGYDVYLGARGAEKQNRFLIKRYSACSIYDPDPSKIDESEYGVH